MLIVSGLLTLLTIAHARGDHIKGGSHGIKGGSSPIAQEAVPQEGILPMPYSFNIKTGAAWGTKVTRQETGDSDGRVKGSYSVSSPRGTSRDVQYHADDTGFHASVKTSEPNIKTHSPANAHIEAISKTASTPVLQQTVKTVPEEHGKLHSVPGVHHAASVPVVQDQITVDESIADDHLSKGIKTLQAVSSGKTQFSSHDMPFRDPIAYPVTQSVKTVKGTLGDSSQGIKSAPTQKRQFTSQNLQGRDPTARPIIRTLKPLGNSAAKASLSTQSSVESIKTGAQQTGIEILYKNGEIIINEDMLKALQSTGGIVNENGKIILTEEAMQLIQKMSGNISDQRPITSLSSLDAFKKETASLDKGIQQKIKPVRIYNADNFQNQGTGGRASSSQNAQGSLFTKVDTRYLTSIRQPVSGTPQKIATSNIRPFDNTLPRQSIFSSQSDIVLFDGKEIRLDDVKEGQLFDENLKPILSVDIGNVAQRAPATSQGVIPVSRAKVTQNIAAISQMSGIQGSLDSAQGGQQDRKRQQDSTVMDGRLTSSPAIRGSITKLVDNKYLTSAQKPYLGTSQTTAPGSQSAFGNRKPDQPVVPLRSDTVLFDGREVRLDNIKEGQLFDENLKPILSVDVGSVTQSVRESTASKAAKPASRARVTQNVATISRTTGIQDLLGRIEGGIIQQGKARQQGATVAGGRLTSSQVIQGSVAGKVDTKYLTSAQKPVSGTSQATGIGSQTAFGNVFSSKSDTVLFEGKEIRLDGLKEGQLFDENMKPILSANIGSVTYGVRAAAATQGAKPASRARVTQNIAAVSRTRDVQGSLGSIQSGISQQGRARQQGATTTGGLLQSSVATRGSIAGRVDTKYLTSVQKPVSGASLATAIGSQSAFSNLQQGQSVFSSKPDTVLFEGKEIRLDGLKAGQLFDENLKPILSTDVGSSIRSSIATQGVKPDSRPRLTQKVATISRTSGVQGSLGSIQGGTGQQGITRQQGAISTSGPLTSPQATQGSIFGRVNTKYLTSVQKPVSGTSQANAIGVQSPFGNRQQGQSVFSSKYDSVLFEGKEIRLDGIKEGQLFDENLKPILSADIGSIIQGVRAPVPSQGVKPASRSRVSQNVGDTFRMSGVQGSLGSIQGETGQQGRTRQQGAFSTSGRLTSSQATRGSIAGRVDTKYLTSVQKPVSGTSQANAIGAQSPFGNRQQGQSVFSSKYDTVLFEGKEIRLDGIKEGQLFDENLKPILSTGVVSMRQGVRPSIVIQGVKPDSRTRVTTQNVATISQSSGVQGLLGSIQGGISQQGRTRQQGTITTGGRLTSSPAIRESIAGRVDTKYLTSPQKPVSGASLETAVGNQNVFGNRQQGQSVVPSKSNTVLFEGKEIPLDGLKEGQLFDENLKPILSTDFGSVIQGVRTSIETQGVKPAGRSRVTQNVAAISRTSGAQGSLGIIQSEINQQGRTRQQDATTTGGRLTSSQISRGSVAGRVDTKYLTSPQKPVSETSRTTATASQNALVNKQRAQTVLSSQSDTVLFDGKEIRLDYVKEGQIFDENLKPILSATSGSFPQGAGQLIGVEPVSRTRVTQNIATISGTSAVQGSTGTLQAVISLQDRTRQQGESLTSDRLASSLGTRGSLYGGIGSRYVLNSRNPNTGPFQIISTDSQGTFSNTLYGQPDISSNEGTALFNGKEIRIDGFKEGQLFDENLKPILSVRSEIIKPASRPSVTQNAASFTRTGATQSRTGTVIDPSVYNMLQSKNLKDITQDEIESKFIQQNVDPKFDEEQKVIQESFIDLPESRSTKAVVSEFSQRAIDPLESKQTQIKVEDTLEHSLSVPDSSKHMQVQERLPVTIAESTTLPKTLSETTNTKVTQVRQEHMIDPTIQQQTSEDVSGYAPKLSFVPSINYGIPQIHVLHSGIKTPTVPEQQKLAQVFV